MKECYPGGGCIGTIHERYNKIVAKEKAAKAAQEKAVKAKAAKAEKDKKVDMIICIITSGS